MSCPEDDLGPFQKPRSEQKRPILGAGALENQWLARTGTRVFTTKEKVTVKSDQPRRDNEGTGKVLSKAFSADPGPAAPPSAVASAPAAPASPVSPVSPVRVSAPEVEDASRAPPSSTMKMLTRCST
eukprot:s569_g7.t1